MKTRRRSLWLPVTFASAFTIWAASSCAEVLGLDSYKDCCEPIGVGEPGECVFCNADGGQGGSAAQCDEPADCPDTDNVCKTRTCSNHQCGVAAVPAGTPTSAQVAGDCREVECDGAGSTKTVDDDTDIEDDGKQCTNDLCENGKPTHPNKPPRTPCTEGGKLCDGHGACVACTQGGDCASTICQVGKCVAPSCIDGVKDGDESDVDCGGACGACPDGDTCNTASDCQGGACDGGVCCTPTTCAALGATCGQHSDACGGMLDCDDGVKNGTETDVDCGGAACPECGVGQNCGVATDCNTPACSGGVCCSTTCSGACFSCATGASGPGTCSAIAYMETSPSCNSSNHEACDGTGTCKGLASAHCATDADCFSDMCDTTKVMHICK